MLRVILEAHNNSEFVLPKYFIQEVLAGSILAQALQEDPEAKELRIPNPIVTPKVMTLLINLSRGLEPIKHDPELMPAAVYLNCERLMVYSHMAYDHNLEKYSHVGYDWALNAPYVIKYRLQKGFKPQSSNLEAACRRNLETSIRLLLPYSDYAPDILFVWAQMHGKRDIFQTALTLSHAQWLVEELQRETPGRYSERVQGLKDELLKRRY